MWEFIGATLAALIIGSICYVAGIDIETTARVALRVILGWRI
jgi:hypothetical protein